MNCFKYKKKIRRCRQTLEVQLVNAFELVFTVLINAQMNVEFYMCTLYDIWHFVFFAGANPDRCECIDQKFTLI